MRIGVFGGAFDPVHYGHLLVAETCREQCALEQVWFLPAATPPHKQRQELASAEHRLQMLHLAVAGSESLIVSDMELRRGGVSWTVDTLASLAAERPDDELFLLMGADSLQDLPAWREPGRICELATLLVVRRRGSAEPDFNTLAGLATAERLEQFRSFQVEMPVIELSATDLRRRAAAGLSLRYRTPRAVEEYIHAHQLYRPST